MHLFALIAGAIIIFAVLLDAFENVVLPRRVRRQFRITSLFYRYTWIPWTRVASRIQSQTRRESFLGYFGPLSLIGLLALWACALLCAAVSARGGRAQSAGCPAALPNGLTSTGSASSARATCFRMPSA